jgi:hypothetical protein
MSIDTWRKFLRDGFRRFIDLGHKFDCKIAHYTCGNICSMISDFIECWIDVLNPLQPEVPNMDYQKVNAEIEVIFRAYKKLAWYSR